MMPRIIESISTINSVFRTVLGFAIIGGVSAISWLGYSAYDNSINQAKRAADDLASARSSLDATRKDLRHARTQIDELGVQIKEQAVEIDRLATSLRLIKVDHRVARLNVLDQIVDEDTGVITSKIQFLEIDDQGQVIGEPQEFELQGQIVYIDGWIVKFDDKYVEEADIERGSSLVLFRRLFGEYQQPNEGFLLDEAGETPMAYVQAGKSSELEKKIWRDFWSIANDSQKARRLGIRAAHGDAPSIKMRKGMSYKIELRASDGLSITPEGPIVSAPST
ncbi:MAG: hypothetical protein ABGX22_01530 [Pirellulaceae bacterium]